MTTNELIGYGIWMIMSIAIGLIVTSFRHDDSFPLNGIVLNSSVVFLLGVLLVGGIRGCYDSTWWQSKLREERLAEPKEDTTPRKIADIDGCATYAFYSAGR